MKNTSKKILFVSPSGEIIEMDLPQASYTLTVNRYSDKTYFLDKIKTTVFLN